MCLEGTSVPRGLAATYYFIIAKMTAVTENLQVLLLWSLWSHKEVISKRTDNDVIQIRLAKCDQCFEEGKDLAWYITDTQ